MGKRGIIAGLLLSLLTACGSDGGVVTNSPAASDRATVAATPTVLLDLAGKGTKTTNTFAATGSWDLTWSYDCTAFLAPLGGSGQGNFIVFVYSADGMPSGNQGVNQLGVKDSGVEHYHIGGSLYLAINSECDWHITATG